MSISVNKAILIGNLTRDPEMRYTPDGQAVCSFGVATNRSWKGKDGEQKEDVEFHNLVAWGKLAELCSQLMKKGRKVFLEGRLQTRSWEGKDGVTRQRTEIVLDDMVLLDSKGAPTEEGTPEQPEEAAPAIASSGVAGEEEVQLPEEKLSEAESDSAKAKSLPAQAGASGGKSKEAGKASKNEEVNEDEIPF